MEKVIIALDFSNKQEVYSFLDKFEDEKLFLKVGMELYYKEGNEFIRELKAKGHNIFLDLKLCDIPNTVYKGLLNLVKLDVDFITVHTLGGMEMLKRAQNAVEGSNTKLLGVTILTSISEKMLNDELNVSKSLEEEVQSLAKLALSAGVEGIVCSAQEVHLLQGKDLICVTPGIRLEEDDSDDQQRVMTPQKAINNGSDFLVVGRSITKKENPKEVYDTIRNSIS